MTPSAWRDMVVLGVLGALLAACDSGTSKKTPPPPPSTFSLTVVISGSGEGSVTSGAQIACQTGATNGCAAEYDEGAQVTLTASPDAGSAFAGWSGDCTGAGTTCQVTMSRAMSVTATFDQIQLTAPLVSSISQGEESQGQVQALSINHYIAAEGIYPSSGGSMNSTGLPYLGQVMLFAGAVVPGGWLRCDGSLLPISGNEALFSLIGTLYGGDGATTFALPDLRDGVAMGVGTISNPAAVPTSPGSSVVPLINSLTEGDIDQGQVRAQGINYYIARSGVFPPRDGAIVVDGFYLGQLMLFAGNFAPGGWSPADGSLLPIASNTALFSLLGTMYGGNGTTTFALPDLRARVPMGVGERTLDPVPASDAQIPLISPMALGGEAQGQVGVLGMNTVIAMGGVYPSTSGSASRVYFASVMHFAGNFAPGGWALADGSVLPISSNTALFSLMGVMYGGNGTTTFALPDLRARVAVGSN